MMGVAPATALPWGEQEKLLASDGSSSDFFGCSVAVGGDTAVAGAHGAKAAYVFVRGGSIWTEQQKLVPSGSGEWFGQSVSLSGDTAAVGAPVEQFGPVHVCPPAPNQTTMPAAGAG